MIFFVDLSVSIYNVVKVTHLGNRLVLQVSSRTDSDTRRLVIVSDNFFQFLF